MSRKVFLEEVVFELGFKRVDKIWLHRNGMEGIVGWGKGRNIGLEIGYFKTRKNHTGFWKGSLETNFWKSQFGVILWGLKRMIL